MDCLDNCCQCETCRAKSNRGHSKACPNHPDAPIDAEFADEQSLASALVALSELTQLAYRVAMDCKRWGVASELRVLANQVAAIIPRVLRGELEKTS